MKNIYLALVCLLVPFYGLAQANFKKGFIVNTQGDTLRGFIDYQELGGKEPTTLTFKSLETDKSSREFTPATSQYALISDLVTYRSFQGRISMDATSLNHLPGHIDTTTRAATVYLKTIQQGKNVSLYTYTDALKTRYFLQKKDGSIQELGFKKHYYKQTNNIVTLKGYIGQLWLTAVELQLGSPALKKKIESAHYTEGDLAAIGMQLNQLALSPKQRQGHNTRSFVGLGINRTVFAVKGQHSLATNAKSKASYLPTLSSGLDVFLNRDIQQFFFRGEVMLHLAAADITSRQQDSRLDRTFNQVFWQPTVTLAPQVIYNLYNREDLKFNLGAGIAFNLSTYLNNVYHTQSTTRADGQQFSDSKVKEHHKFSSIWFAFPLRTGLILNQKTDISVLYFIPSSLTRYLRYSFSRSSLQLGVNYLFSRK